MNTVLPIQQSSRTIIVDIIRGFALFGVLAANLTGFIIFALPEDKAALLSTTIADKFTEYFVSFFIDGKFIMIFSILFGYGFGVLMERVASKGIHANRFFIRRMIILLVMGLIHLAIWWGEILNVYAMAGLLMLLFRNVRTKKILWWGLFLLFIVTPLLQGFRIFFLPPAGEKLKSMLTDYDRGILSGNFFEMVKSNYSISNYIFIERCSQMKDVAEALGKFLIGYFIFRSGYLKDLSGNIGLIKKVSRIAMVIAILYLIKKVAMEIMGLNSDDRWFRLFDYELSNIGILSLSIVYCTTLIRIYYRKNNLRIFKWLSAVGMMSLTNYLTHTILYAIIFYGFGFAQLGKMHMQWVFPLALSIFAFQIFFSLFWMKRFQYGIAEWIWRMLSYNKYIPIKK